MAWDRRSRSLASSSRGRGTTAMNSLESTSSLQPWACSSLSSSEKFHSLYEKMQEDREKNNLESLISTPSIEQHGLLEDEQQHFPTLPPRTLMMTDWPGSKIVFPHITSRGSLVGNKVYCRTSLHTSITWRQKRSTQRMQTSLRILNYYQDRSCGSNLLLLGGEQRLPQRSPPAGPAVSITSLQRPDNSLDKGQCRSLFLSLAGAAGMRLICPPVQLPLLEILLFFREQLSKSRAAPRSERGRTGLWRLPVNLALAMLRPFCGSSAGRCLTAIVCLAQMRTKTNDNYSRELCDPMRYISVPADLYSVASTKGCNTVDHKEFTKTCSVNQFQIDGPVVTMTDAGDDVAAIDPTGPMKIASSNLSIMLLSNVVLTSELEEECWSNNGVQVVEVLISESEDSIAEDTLPNCSAKQKNIGFDSASVCSADTEFSLIDFEEDSSSGPCLKLKESEKSSSENFVAFASRNELYAGVEEVRENWFAQSNFAVSPPSLRLPYEAPYSITVVNAPADWLGTVSALEDSESVVAENAMPSTDRVCLSEEVQSDSTSLSQITPNLQTSTTERAEDDEPGSSCRECDRAATVVEFCPSTPQSFAEETVESENQEGSEVFDGKVVHFVERESLDKLVEQEVAFCFVEEHRIDDMNCVVSEGVQLQLQVEVSLFEGTKTENKDSSTNPRRQFQVEFDGDASDGLFSGKLPEKTVGISDWNKLEKADVTIPVESIPLVLEEMAKNGAVNELQELKCDVRVVDEESAGSIFDSPIEEHVINGRVCVSPERLPDLMELLMDANWIGARKEFADAALLVPAKPSPALSGVTEHQAVKNGNEGQFMHSVGKHPATKVLHQGLVVGAIENYAVGEIQEVKSEHCTGGKQGEEDHRHEVDDCDWLESLLEQVEVFISERADALSEYERAAVSKVVENQEDNDIQEMNSRCPEEGISPESVLYQELEVRPFEEHRIDDGSCVRSERLQDDTEVSLSYRRSSEIERDDNESSSASAVMVSLDNLSLRLAESVEKEVVKEIEEVNTSHLTEEKPADGLIDLGRDHEVCCVEDCRIGDRVCELVEMLQGERDSLHSQRTSAQLDSEMGVPAPATLSLTVGSPSSAVTELLEDQPIKEIHEVTSSEVVENYEERIANQESEVCSIQGGRIGHRDCKLPEILQVQVEVSLPVRFSAESEPEIELPGNRRGKICEKDASVPQQEERNCSSSTSILQERCTSQEHDLFPSLKAMTGDDSRSEAYVSSNHSGATSRDSCMEHPESNVIDWTGEGSSEPSTLTCGAWRKSSYARCFDSNERIVLLCILLVPFFCSSTSRLNNATEAVDKALDPDSGTIAVVLDDELNYDEKCGHRATEAKVLHEIKTGSIVADDDSQLSTAVSVSDENSNLDSSSAVAGKIDGNRENNCPPVTCSKSSPSLDTLRTTSCFVPPSYLEHPFADHPKCVELRERRHSHGGQTYIDMQDLLPAPWGQLIFWHGRCKEGRPTLCVMLGKAVRELPGDELKDFIEVTVSHLEYAELNFFKGNVRQMNILMDLEGIGFMRLPPMHILSAIGAVLNRDYAGRGGWIILVNAPLMLGFVISAIQGVILRPSNNKGAVIDSSFKGFLEGKERIMMMGGKYKTALQKYFDTRMLPVALGGDCACSSDENRCKLGNEFLSLPWDTSSHA